MKHISLKNILFLGALLLTGSGCQKYLSTQPAPRASIDSPESMSELLVSAYPDANYMAFCETRSDNVAEIPEVATAVANTEAYLWDIVSATGADSEIRYWNRCYEAIAVANLALDAIAHVEKPDLYRAQKGEALVARAYTHFMLASLFSKIYNPATAASDPGIPYVTEPENVVIKKYERKTVAYVYEQIEKDLEEGIPLINDNAYKIPAYHFTVRAAYAFATRFYLFKRDWPKVIHYAGLAFPNKSYLAYLRPWATTYSSMTGADMRANYNKATEKANLLLKETISSWATQYDNRRYMTHRDTLLRLISKASDNLIQADMAYVTGSAGNNASYINKMARYFKASSPNSNLGNYFMTITLLTTEEVLFNQAEAYAMEEQYAESLELLNIFISTRVKNFTAAGNLTTERIMEYFYPEATAPYDAALLKEAHVKAVLELKRAEFMHEGLRWLDILRKDITVTHTRDRGNKTDVLGPDDPRRVLQLPPLTALSGLEPNPR